MLRIIDRYVFKECASATLGVIAVLLLILLGNTLVRILGDIAEGKLPGEALWPMLSINLVHYLIVLIPFGMYLGILFGMGRLYKDSEMTALFACGIGTRRLYRAVLALALPLTLLTVFLSMLLAPWTVGKQDAIKHAAKYQSELYGLVPGQFNTSGNGRQTLFFEHLAANGREMRQTFLHSLGEDMRLITTARKAVRSGKAGQDPYIVFEQGTSYSGIPGQLDYRITQFETQGVRIQQAAPPALSLRISATPTPELITNADPKAQAEWHWRLAIPVASLLLALFALPLSYTSPRKGRFAKLGIGVLIYIIYTNLLGLGRAWVERAIVPDWLGMWWVHALMLGWLLLLLAQREGAGLSVIRKASGSGGSGKPA
ncbi:MAG TPA: LPS export ABC transporter permease LptF [Gammaproteobacteria bacterium]